ncbi:antibiotic biosynthesis monooxygenase [Microbacterium oryzae]|uniref:Antibiotic biosynthesis monooxygenase n=1 Tax=Microbacterium oryzae TaxID=743009 RepID=A0A6I6DPF7_9MICO|nr:antibiotic biosynthesis monooxygenase [Microbacterium oryzae]QGU26752.1 antibiotic biosynthesis monooxygenase [Microbacterium oryzae]
MSAVRLTGRLVCKNEVESRLVAEHLPRHVALTRTEPGCLAFAVTPSSDPLVWDVDEQFADEPAFRMHQERVASSEWGRATAGIERRYSVLGLTDRRTVSRDDA